MTQELQEERNACLELRLGNAPSPQQRFVSWGNRVMVPKYREPEFEGWESGEPEFGEHQIDYKKIDLGNRVYDVIESFLILHERRPAPSEAQLKRWFTYVTARKSLSQPQSIKIYDGTNKWNPVIIDCGNKRIVMDTEGMDIALERIMPDDETGRKFRPGAHGVTYTRAGFRLHFLNFGDPEAEVNDGMSEYVKPQEL